MAGFCDTVWNSEMGSGKAEINQKPEERKRQSWKVVKEKKKGKQDGVNSQLLRKIKSLGLFTYETFSLMGLNFHISNTQE